MEAGKQEEGGTPGVGVGVYVCMVGEPDRAGTSCERVFEETKSHNPLSGEACWVSPQLKVPSTKEMTTLSLLCRTRSDCSELPVPSRASTKQRAGGGGGGLNGGLGSVGRESSLSTS